MDTLTHGLSGALLGRALSSRAMNVKPKVFLVVGFLAAMFQDVDIVSGLFGGDAGLLYHRGITHSIILLPLWAALLSYIMAVCLKRQIIFKKDWVEKLEEVSIKTLFKELYLLTSLSILIHIFGDLITQFGTMIFAPFSDARFEWGSVFIIDLWFTGILILGLIFSSISKYYKALIASCFLFVWLGYIGFTYYEKQEAQKIGFEYAKKQNLNLKDIVVYTSPRPVSAKNWTVSIYDPKSDNYYVSDLSLLDKKFIYSSTVDLNFISRMNNDYPSYQDAKWYTIKRWGRTPEEEVIAHRVWEDPLFKNYRWFYMIPTFDLMFKTKFETCGYFKDLRYASSDSTRDAAFTYGICYSKTGEKYKSEMVGGHPVKRE